MISAIILTHNDDVSIKRTLESVSWCDEVIVVDDYSTNATADIAKKLGTTVYSRHLTNDFSAQRNFGLTKANGDWILFVDSDEVVSKNLANEIKQITSISSSRGLQQAGVAISEIASLKTPRNDKLNGYYIKRQDFLFGSWLRHGETGDMKLLRLAKNDAGKWTRPVHEVWDIQGPTGVLKNPLLHYPHPNVAQFLAKINLYSTLNAQYLYKTNAPSYAWHILVYPKAKFFVNYIIRLGFLDGMQGLILAILMSFHSFLTRGKLWLLYRRHD